MGGQSPEEKANRLSLLTFSWLNPLISEGYRRPLTEDDAFDLLPDDTAEVTTLALYFHTPGVNGVTKRCPWLLPDAV